MIYWNIIKPVEGAATPSDETGADAESPVDVGLRSGHEHAHVDARLSPRHNSGRGVPVPV